MNLHEDRARQLPHAGLLGYRLPAAPSPKADWAEALVAGFVTLVAIAAWWAVIVAVLG